MKTAFSRRSRALLGKPFLAIALAMGTSAMIAASPVATAQEEEQKLENSREFASAFKPVFDGYATARTREDVQAKNAELRAADSEAKAAISRELSQMLAEDLANLRASKSAIKNESDRFVWGQYAINYGVLTGDEGLQIEGIDAETASGKQSMQRKGQLANAKAMILFGRGDYAGARTAFEAALAAGQPAAGLRQNIAVTYIREGNREGALEYLIQTLEDQKASGSVDEELLTRVFSISRELERPESQEYAYQLAEMFPNETNWANAIILVRDDATLDDEAILDVQRLMLRTESYQNVYDLSEMVAILDARKRPQEVLDVLDVGIAAGLIDPNSTLVADARPVARRQIEADKTELAELESEARAADAEAITPTVAGDAYLNYGQAAKAEELYRIALSKPNANTALIKTRLGIAQLDQGKYDEARATFAEITGQRQPIGRLWSIYAAQQGG